ncbi:MAG TPA: LacI family DNA-binding transcriptional regulator [Candidatus Limnocylindrales bacterium]
MARGRATSADVAKLAGVSRTTVSVVLTDRQDIHISPATRRRVFDAAERLDYHAHAPARQLAAGTSLTIGLVLRQSSEQVAGDALLGETLRGVTAAARAGGYRVLVEALPPGTGGYEEIVRSRQTDGIIVSGPRADDVALSNLARDDFPVILQGWLPRLNLPSVDVDNRAGARAAVELLVRQGHRSIGCITNAPLAYTAALERLSGYREALEASSIPFDPDRVVEAEFDAASGYRAMRTLLDRSPGCTAVFVASDVVAFGAMGALRDGSRRVPEDVSVVAFDDIPLAAYFDPPLTTVRIPAFELGQAAGQALLDRVVGRPVAARTLLPTELVVRASAAPPPVPARAVGSPTGR